jgi:hypothetical protein
MTHNRTAGQQQEIAPPYPPPPTTDFAEIDVRIVSLEKLTGNEIAEP